MRIGRRWRGPPFYVTDWSLFSFLLLSFQARIVSTRTLAEECIGYPRQRPDGGRTRTSEEDRLGRRKHHRIRQLITPLRELNGGARSIFESTIWTA